MRMSGRFPTNRPTALRAGFEWYRAFDQDVKDNREAASRPVDTPVLYVRGVGGGDGGDIHAYIHGLRDAGLRHVRGEAIEGSGHFVPTEQPERVAAALLQFMHECSAARVAT